MQIWKESIQVKDIDVRMQMRECIIVVNADSEKKKACENAYE